MSGENVSFPERGFYKVDSEVTDIFDEDPAKI